MGENIDGATQTVAATLIFQNKSPRKRVFLSLHNKIRYKIIIQIKYFVKLTINFLFYFLFYLFIEYIILMWLVGVYVYGI